MASSHAGPRRMQPIRSHPFSYQISQKKRLPSKFDGGQRWSMAWYGSIQSLQRIQKAAHEVDSIDLNQIWRPNLSWKHGFDGNAHCRGLTKQVIIQSMLSSFLFRTTMYGSCKAVHNDLLRADLNIIVNLCSIYTWKWFCDEIYSGYSV